MSNYSFNRKNKSWQSFQVVRTRRNTLSSVLTLYTRDPSAPRLFIFLMTHCFCCHVRLLQTVHDCFMILKKILQSLLHGTLKMFPRKPALVAHGGKWHSNRNIWQLNKRHNRLKLLLVLLNIIVCLLRRFFNFTVILSACRGIFAPGSH